MSERKWGADADAGDLADAPFLDDAERAESAWLIAREQDPGARPPSAKIASDHAEIADLLNNLPLGPSDESWHDDVLKRASASASVTPLRPWWRKPALRWATGGALAAAAAAMAVVVLRPRPPVPGEELEVAIHHGDPARGDKVVVGDRLIVKAHPGSASESELRVYRADGPLVARCPTGPRCTAAARGEYVIDVPLDAPVQYHVILVVGLRDLLPDGPMDTYIDAAGVANAHIVMYQPIDVH